ncbi:hypothetical protein AiwAL_12805 [Acidiphilium sp. AL]|uniref:Uncharacterized protein n=1 Tax=Acidiphilium iwatense TaxID=768198 RepID=A0ABS9DWE4_9PROT|nr:MULTISPECIES: hypothetical protein [Acidiphilium]MCF3946105.1 hypothetical protein [Acidiphilium iwatense]MCU4160975.1 hypothetical protein [Acidiphilium sp. AL]
MTEPAMAPAAYEQLKLELAALLRVHRAAPGPPATLRGELLARLAALRVSLHRHAGPRLLHRGQCAHDSGFLGAADAFLIEGRTQSFLVAMVRRVRDLLASAGDQAGLGQFDVIAARVEAAAIDDQTTCEPGSAALVCLPHLPHLLAMLPPERREAAHDAIRVLAGDPHAWPTLGKRENTFLDDFS